MLDAPPPPHENLKPACLTTLTHLDTLLERPMIILRLVWLGLLVVDLVQGLSPFLQGVSNVIWGLLVLALVIASDKSGDVTAARASLFVGADQSRVHKNFGC